MRHRPHLSLLRDILQFCRGAEADDRVWRDGRASRGGVCGAVRHALLCGAAERLREGLCPRGLWHPLCAPRPWASW